MYYDFLFNFLNKFSNNFSRMRHSHFLGFIWVRLVRNKSD